MPSLLLIQSWFCPLGSLKYWYERNKVNFLAANSAVWNDDAVHGALDSAAFWVKNLPFVKSLSGYWKFFLASSPKMVPENFFDNSFQDFDWATLPGKHINIYLSRLWSFDMQTCNFSDSFSL